MKNHQRCLLRSFIYVASFLFPVTATFADDELDQAINQIADMISKSTHEPTTRTIAVADFAMLDGTVTTLGQHLAESLITELFRVAPYKFEVVERRHLALVLMEQKIAANQLFDPKSLSRIGKLLQVQEIATGTITDLTDQIEINSRLISVETGRITAVDRRRIRKLGSVSELLNKIAVAGQADDSKAPPKETPDAVEKKTGNIPRHGSNVDGVVIEIVRAVRKGTNVSVELAFTSTRRDLDLSLWGDWHESSTAVTNNAMSYRAREPKLGMAEHNGFVEGRLLAGTRVQGELTFHGVESDATSISLEIRGMRKNAGADDNSWQRWSLAAGKIPIDK
ncbi:MAG: hypothetical protein HY287_00005 [Planctomycetes bacterium]|nr:hypothetical protein [Planctomycetota bacterium]